MLTIREQIALMDRTGRPEAADNWRRFVSQHNLSLDQPVETNVEMLMRTAARARFDHAIAWIAVKGTEP